MPVVGMVIAESERTVYSNIMFIGLKMLLMICASDIVEPIIPGTYLSYTPVEFETLTIGPLVDIKKGLGKSQNLLFLENLADEY